MSRALAGVLAAALLAGAAAAQLEDTPDQVYLDAYAAYEVNDYVRARELALRAALSGHTRAHVLAGNLLENGLGGERDDLQAARLYQTAASAGEGEAFVALGIMARDNRGGLTPSAAPGFFESAAALGRDDGLVELAMLYVDGIGVTRDPDEARVLLGQAALGGSRPAQRALGLLLLTTAVSEAELHEAETWLVAAADAGDAEAAYALGIGYATGDDFPADDAKAASYLKIAADAGDAAAAADYGLLVYQGRGAEQSFEEAASWFRRAALRGDQEGQFLYAFALARGEGVARDLEEAYYWARRSASAGESSALNYEVDRYNLLAALEASLDDEAKARVEARGAPRSAP